MEELPRRMFMSVSEAAQILGVSAKAFRARIHRGDGPKTVRTNRSLLIKTSDFQVWLETLEEVNPSTPK